MLGYEEQEHQELSGEYQDDARLQPLLDEIKRHGLHIEDEPSPIYWANFRVRVMDQIAQNEPANDGLIARAWQWITARPLVMGAAGLSAAALVAGVFLINPFGSTSPQLASNNPQISSPDATTPTQQIQNLRGVQKRVTATSHPTVPSSHEIAQTKKAVEQMVKSPEFANRIEHAEKSDEHPMAEATSPEQLSAESQSAVSTMTTSDADMPVSLNSLSQGELESVLQHLESEK
jgi:hypothetical protein